MSLIIPFITGLIFGVGLVVSGMSNPANVIAFLDLAGNWDPGLGFVMAGAVLTFGIGFPLIRKKQGKPLFSTTFTLPTSTELDRPLIIGAIIFGIGWGIGGFCPGPALVNVLSGSTQGLLFVASMLIGMLVGVYRKS